MARPLKTIKKRLITAVSCGLVGVLPVLGGCIEAKPAYGMPPDCDNHRVSCSSNQTCEDQCGADWYCDDSQDQDAGFPVCRPVP